MNFPRISLVILMVFLTLGCSGSQLFIDRDKKDWTEIPLPGEELIYQVFLIGDAGGSSRQGQEPTLRLFKKFTESAGKQSAAVFLGDNIYPAGLPDSSSEYRAFAEYRLKEQLKTVEHFKGRVIVIPGNHDWNDGREGGYEAILRQEQFVEEYLNRGNTFLPDEGFPGPVDIELMDDDEHPALRNDIRIIVIDTQWWLHNFKKPFGDTGEYELLDGGDFLTELEGILKKRQNDFLIVAAHHPLLTLGPHGGYVPPSRHLKPPIFGSLYAFYRRAFGYEQDLPHYRYREFAKTLRNMMKLNDHLIYASGHSHSLQYFRETGKRETQHYVVSGSGTKQNFVAKGRGSEFSYAGKGFITLNYYADGSVWMEAWAPVGDGTEGKLLYRTQMKPPYADPLINEDKEALPDIDYSGQTVRTAPNPEYDQKGKVFRAIAGNHNRHLWSIESEYPVFDITEVKGGLTPVRMGGKGQSTTLHLEDKEGNEYVLRSVDKQAGKIWDEELRKTFALDLAQDQFSILNPYGALLIPSLAGAVKVYHTNPAIYYVPDDPLLGEYGDQIGGQLALFEEKPDNDMSHVGSVGYSEEVMAHRDMIRKVDGDIDHRVDQKMFAWARLLDMLIGDWDRHSDQWRWASFEPEDEQGKIYRPVPRDRDAAFMKMTGLIPTIAKYGPFFQYQNFGESYGSLYGLNYNSLALTRRFTNQLTKEDWLFAAEWMQNQLTDEIIDQAVANYPPEVYERQGAETARILKLRRNKLKQIAEKYYSMLAGVVSVPGSHKRERFVVETLDTDELRLRVYKLSGKGELREKYFDRNFTAKETGELRLFGMGSEDEFLFKGKDRSPIRLVVSGGPGKDVYTDDSEEQILSRSIEVFDTEEGNVYQLSAKAHLHLKNDPVEHYYNYERDFNWDRTQPGYFFSYNDDDGLFIGGGPRITRFGFRKFPAAEHYLRVNYAPKTGAANMRYSGTWFERVGNWDAGLEAAVLFPKSYKNFFGLGNETTLEDRSSRYYRARLTRYVLDPSLNINLNQALSFKAGNRLSVTKIDDNRDESNVINEPGVGISPDTFEDQWFNSVYTRIQMKDLDDQQNPNQGYNLSLRSEINIGIRNTTQTFTRLLSELEFYFPINFSPQITLANRTGGAHNIGPFPFYESNTIGGTTNLRGFRGNRFSGRSSFYNNSELRIELFDFYRYVLGGRVGLTVFYDTGRVWTDGESSDIWHKGYGGGVWFNFFDSMLINSTLGISGEGTLFEIKAGFFF